MQTQQRQEGPLSDESSVTLVTADFNVLMAAAIGNAVAIIISRLQRIEVLSFPARGAMGWSSPGLVTAWIQLALLSSVE